MSYYLYNFICASIGTICFAMLYNVTKRYYFSIGLVGGIGYLIYLIIILYSTPAIATFIASLFVVLASRILAIYKKCPITIFLVSGVLPLIPSPKIFYTSYYIIQYEYELALMNGMFALKVAFAIVLAISFVLAIPRSVFEGKLNKLFK